MFNKHTLDKQFYNVKAYCNLTSFFKFMSLSRDNGKDILAYYRSLTQEEKRLSISTRRISRDVKRIQRI